MKMLVFRPGEPGKVEDIDGFAGIQKACDGCIERVTIGITTGRELNLWVNEDGISMGLPPNIKFGHSVLFGTVVLAAAAFTEDGDQTEVELTEDEIEEYRTGFHRLSPT